MWDTFVNFANYADAKICNTKNLEIVDEFCERILKNKKANARISESDILRVIEK